jgi:V/A-type H+-transporting ATPase subunit I
MGVRAVLGSNPAWFDALGLGLPLLGLVFEERLAALVDGPEREEDCGPTGPEGKGEVADAGDGASAREVAHAGDGAFAGAVKGFVALLEALSYYLSNTLSFLRVGAFALSHAVLSYIVFTMGDMVRQRSSVGFIGQIAIVIFGNAIIIFLEGLIVAIQIVRLEYYEFLSKFLTETGSPFLPFKFQFRKEQP